VRGVGKTTAARVLAKALNCEQGPTPTPCNTCSNCQEITAGNAIDVLEIDGAIASTGFEGGGGCANSSRQQQKQQR
jgi:DNA polymerase III gamma/tau subunit